MRMPAFLVFGNTLFCFRRMHWWNPVLPRNLQQSDTYIEFSDDARHGKPDRQCYLLPVGRVVPALCRF